MKKYLFLIFAMFPIVTYAISDLGDVVSGIFYIIELIIPIIIGLALIVFLWGIVKYIWKGDDEKQREESKQFILWGLVGLGVMVSVWGLVYLIAGLFGLNINSTLSLPPKQK